MKLFKCQHCGQLLYFENTGCERCGHRLGFISEIMTLSAVEPEGDAWRALAVNKKTFRFCANAEFDVCNWMVDAGGPEKFCAACRHNRTVPDTSIAENVVAWRKIEIAKHRLFDTLMKLNLPLDARDENGRIGPPSTSGEPAASRWTAGDDRHDNGLITLALEEADDAERERRRMTMHEPYRTLLGHFRHEVGHYFWDVLVRDGGLIEACRNIFGDELADYDQALQNHYAHGAPPNWQESFISAYATSHPWEDFAETWAITCISSTRWKWARLRHVCASSAGAAGRTRRAGRFRSVQCPRSLVADRNWISLSNALNSLNRTMDYRIFILSSCRQPSSRS